MNTKNLDRAEKYDESGNVISIGKVEYDIDSKTPFRLSFYKVGDGSPEETETMTINSNSNLLVIRNAQGKTIRVEAYQKNTGKIYYIGYPLQDGVLKYEYYRDDKTLKEERFVKGIKTLRIIKHNRDGSIQEKVLDKE